jgi:hypothetical protein
MAFYTELEIYKTSYHMLILISKKIKHFPKDYKYSLDDKLRQEIIDLVFCIFKANSAKNKNPYIEQLI